MSDPLIGAIIAVGGTVITALGTLWINRRFEAKRIQAEIAERQRIRLEDNAEWYERALFEKRLAAHQEAYSWLVQLNHAINRAEDGETSKQLYDLAEEARRWYDDHALAFLDGLPSASHFLGAINSAQQWARGQREDLPIWDLQEDAMKAVRAASATLMAPRLPT